MFALRAHNMAGSGVSCNAPGAPIIGGRLVMRIVTVGAAPLGQIQKADGRQQVVARMLDLMQQAKAKGCDLIVYPELALTTFFPRWYMTDQAEVDTWFEREMPNAATRPLFEKAAEYRIGISFGY